MNLATIATIGAATGGCVLQAVCGASPEESFGLIGVTAVGSLLAGLGSELLATAIERSEEERRATKNLLFNEDLASATANALKQFLTKAADKMDLPYQASDRTRLKKIATEAHSWWMKIACDQTATEFEALREDSIVNGLTLLLSNLENQRSGYVPPKPVTLETWADLLRTLDQSLDGEPQLSGEAVHVVAEQLHEHVLKNIYHAVRNDLQYGGRVYAAISLRFMAEILSEVRQLRDLPADLRNALDETEHQLRNDLDRISQKLESVDKKLDQLTPSTLPFVRVRGLGLTVYGTDDPVAFTPSLREFEEGCVYRPALLEQVQAMLIANRFACVLGKGASGKTTLALLLAFSKAFGPERSYYFDLAVADDSPEAAERYRAAMQAIARQHGREALVIVDNIHLAEGLAHQLHLAWREEGQQVRLLLQGRLTKKGADRYGRRSPLEELNRTALPLEVTPNDLAGVLQRLVRRAIVYYSVSAISPVVLEQWLEVFAGDLIAFSSAARRKLPQIVRGQYQLTEADSEDYIRDEYLNSNHEKPKCSISDPERENLLAIAACADWELPVPAEGLQHPPGSALAISMRRGLVWQTTHGRFGQKVRYRLCHPGMGKLLWAAAKPKKSKLDSACEISQCHPLFGFDVASCLVRLNNDDEGAKRVLVAVTSKPDAFERLIEIEILSPTQCRQLTELKVVSETSLDQKLVACENLVASALATRLHVFRNFLEYAQIKLPTVWQALAHALAKQEHRQSLVQSALATPPAELAFFLKYAQDENNLPAVFKAIRDALELPENSANRAQLVQAALALPRKKLAFFLQKLAFFLKYAQDENNLPAVFKAIRDALELPENSANRAQLVQAALATPLGYLASFLKYAQTNLPNVWKALADALAKEENRATLVRAALATPLAHLANFLEYARTPMPKVWQALADALAKEENRVTLA
jgi:hypothetical protein